MIKLNQSSTKTGLILLGSVIAGMVTGNSELVQVSIGETGAQVGGLLPTLAATAIGIFDTVRQEKG
ncbi:hypothetical protein ACFFLZ_06445 [Photobacterium aphoticum]|uniref:Uncharacterized protein n=1 Tax=Photobacterium aphoticum TaxID=754436 RepID=A0A090QJ74_9GAMM|nr:hypothetical protein [Photobacterium aphoticum]KLV02000.1 hypothetical protein ABT58_06345 [Photobacterium aphoticum]PSU60246.1 hypothetical protein C9I90_01100 [Photobacterium aphoticum]GAL02961.1 hypothetical protein JCM19237_5854 [Photobacterium aphoticum]GHA34332.1 hypothetical protein GCM10007086_04740 [Photobacterium aphoticum]